MTTPAKPSFTPGELAQIACLMEVTARKPGNVHRGADFADAHYLDFVLSASALVGPLNDAAQTGVGSAVLGAVESTRRLVSHNTNLGMILLLAPLAAVPSGVDLRSGVQRVMALTTVEDAIRVYQAIRLAKPGGLGTADEQDVASEPSVTLVEAMRLAADRDLVARQLASGYSEVFDVTSPALSAALTSGHSIESAIILAQLTTMALTPDSLILRKRGPDEAAESSRMAVDVLRMGWPDGGQRAFDTLDEWLRAEGHARNPGAVADLVCGALYVLLRDGTIGLPISARWSHVDPSPP